MKFIPTCMTRIGCFIKIVDFVAWDLSWRLPGALGKAIFVDSASHPSGTHFSSLFQGCCTSGSVVGIEGHQTLLLCVMYEFVIQINEMLISLVQLLFLRSGLSYSSVPKNEVGKLILGQMSDSHSDEYDSLFWNVAPCCLVGTTEVSEVLIEDGSQLCSN